MTLTEVTNQLYNLSIDGFFNGEKRTKEWLKGYIQKLTRPELEKHSIIFDIALPDGWWFVKVERRDDVEKGFYDYYIPDTRTQERTLLDELAG